MTEATPTDVINNNFEAAKTAISNCAPISLVQTVNGKQDAISDLATIRANATAGAGAASTISGYGDIVTHNASEFLTSHQDISGKADKATTLAGYGITNAYTKTEADTAISTAIAGASHLKRLIVTQLPSPSSADENTVYMVLKSSGISGNIYDEYLLIDGAFEKIGDTQVDLSGYVTSVNNVNPVNGNVTLSIPDAQIQSDWNQTTTTAKDYIKNKPLLATVATSGSYADLSNKPTIPAEQVQSDWNVTDTSSKAYIKNKPTIPSAITVDAALSTTSENPVQNKVITTELNKKIEGISSSDVTTALGYTPYNSTNPNGYTSNVGTITGIKMNGSSKGTSGVVDLGTVITAHQDISGKVNVSDIASSVSASSTNTVPVGAKLFYDTCGDIETLINAL